MGGGSNSEHSQSPTGSLQGIGVDNLSSDMHFVSEQIPAISFEEILSEPFPRAVESLETLTGVSGDSNGDGSEIPFTSQSHKLIAADDVCLNGHELLTTAVEHDFTKGGTDFVAAGTGGIGSLKNSDNADGRHDGDQFEDHGMAGTVSGIDASFVTLNISMDIPLHRLFLPSEFEHSIAQ